MLTRSHDLSHLTCMEVFASEAVSRFVRLWEEGRERIAAAASSGRQVQRPSRFLV